MKLQKTTHKENCTRVFKNYDKTCERCLELLNGAPARKGWNDDKIEEYARFKRQLAAHKCTNCGPVCTAFEW